MEGSPCGVRKSIVTPRLRALRASDVNVRTTPLTCGCQASVAISTRIGRLAVCGRRRARRGDAPHGRERASRAQAVIRGGLELVHRVSCRDNYEFIFQSYDGTVTNVAGRSKS